MFRWFVWCYPYVTVAKKNNSEYTNKIQEKIFDMFGDYLLVSARRMIQVMSGVTDPRVQQLQVKKCFC